jgi:raffinose/stachyose/melibiose transport system permease protein
VVILKIKHLKQEIEYEILVLPAFILFTTFSILPLVGGFVLSLTNWNGLNFNLKFVGLKNYIHAFTASDYILPSFEHTLLITLVTTILFTLLAIPLAVILDSKIPFSKFYKAAFFFPSVPSALVVGYMWQFMLSSSSYGFVNSIIAKFGINPINWTGNSTLAFVSIIIVQLWGFTGWHVVLYIANLQSIPAEYYEAANIDGASKIQSFRYVTLPLLAPAMSISILFSITGAMKIYDIVYALTGGGPGTSTYVVVQAILREGIDQGKYGLANAASIVLFLIILIFSLIQQKAMNRREENLG